MVASTRFVLVIALVGCGFDTSGVGGSASASGSGDTTGGPDTTGDPSTTTTASTSATTTSATTTTSTTEDTTLTTSMSSTTNDDTSTTASDTGETGPQPESSGEDDTTATTSTAEPEVCDGVDNDGDGGIDEGSGLNASCNGCTFVLSWTGEYWFSICSTPQTWDEGRIRCAQFAGDLAKIENDADQLTLLALVIEDHWMGIDDRNIDGVWVWVDGTGAKNGGVVNGYDGWGAGQPDGGLVENCAELDPGQLGWADSPCEQMQPIVCRHPD